jgi:diguanylate cyclase (GGDEF)-like protein
MLFDLDHFKSINDHYGHMVGDAVLRQIVKSLDEVCRASDVICRWGGEEFLVIGRFTDRSLAPAHAERIRRRVESCEVQIEGHAPLRVTCSVGYVSYPFQIGDGGRESWHRFIALADQATYIAKREGRNRCAGLVAGPQARLIGNSPITPDMVRLWIAQGALLLEHDAGKAEMVAAL